MMIKSWIISFGLLPVLFFTANSRAGLIQPDLGRSLSRLSPADEVPVIITLNDQVDLKQFKDKDRKSRRFNMNKALRARADSTQKPLKNFLQKKNARKIKSFWIFNGMAATLRADQVEDLANRPEVQSISLDAVLSLPTPVPSQAAAPEWNLEAIHAQDLWEIGFTGEGVVVASMDTGVDFLHPDIGPKWRGGTNSWFDPFGEHPTPYDNSGHGTAVIGIMVGGDAGGTSIGVAPGAQWISVKLFSDNPALNPTLDNIVYEGFEWLLDPDGLPATDDAPDVVNNSWGYEKSGVNKCYSPDPNYPFQLTIQALKTAGIAMVFSAGNAGSGSATSISPANYPESFAAGSVDQTLQVDSTSSRGPSACDGTIFPEIVAPGANIRSAGLTSGGFNPYSYSYNTGTSFAAPHVAGAMALLLSADPLLTPGELETLLMDSAVDLGSPGADNDSGYGLLDARAAAYNLSLFDIYLLTVSISGNGRGSVISDPQGVNCPADCVKDSLNGTVVTLTAVPKPNSTFTGWGGDCAGLATTCQVTMDQVKNVTAGFYAFPWETFIPIIINGNGKQ